MHGVIQSTAKQYLQQTDLSTQVNYPQQHTKKPERNKLAITNLRTTHNIYIAACYWMLVVLAPPDTQSHAAALVTRCRCKTT